MLIPQPIKDTYAELCAPPEGADAAWFKQRGYRFESLLADLLRTDNLDPRTSYKAPGEQIDGSFFLDGTVFLIEAKWHKDKIPASTLYQFKGKVDGKLVGTIGIFLSMSGYSQDAVDALTLGKSLNLVLFDKRDIDAAINRELGFRAVLKQKLRQAAEEGVVYFPAEAELVTGNNSSQVDIERLGYDRATGSVFSQKVLSTSNADLIIVCEGEPDRELLAFFAGRILASVNSRKAIKIVVAMGKFTVPRVANAVHALGTQTSKVLIVVDGDDDPAKSLEMLERSIDFEGWVAAIPEPEIESWLGLDRRTLQRLGPEKRTALSLQAAERVDVKLLRNFDKAFSVFYDFIVNA